LSPHPATRVNGPAKTAIPVPAKSGAEKSVPEKSAEPSSTYLFLRMLGFAWRYRWQCLWLLGLQTLLQFFTITSLQFLGAGIDLIHYLKDSTREPPKIPYGIDLGAGLPAFTQVTRIALVVLAIELTRAAINFIFIRTSGWIIHTRIVPHLRLTLYDKMQRLSFRFFDANATGSIINRVTSDAQSVRAFIDAVLIQLALLVISFVFYLVAMVRIHPMLTIACLATTPLMAIATQLFSRRVRPQYDKNRDLVDDLILRLSENIQGAQVLKGFGREPEEIGKFTSRNDAVRDQQQGIFWLVSIFTPTVGFMTQLNIVILLAYGGWLVATGQLQIGTGLIVFAGLLQQFSSQIANITNITNSIQQSLSGAKRVFEILDAPTEVQSKPDAQRLPRAGGRLVFENVSFAYGDGPLVLKDVSFTMDMGESLAILGPTGAGKSTLFALICRFYDPTAGRITLDGIDLRDLNLDDLRRGIGLVFQETFLFGNTVSANIAFGHPEATQEQVETACKIAAAHPFVSELPEGYDTILGESGLDLSGGQRQRLAIARAVLLDPAVLLLDDPAASVDPHTEEEILSAIDGAMAGRTTLIIAHRLSTLRRVDRVIVLEEGRIVQAGTHAELLTQGGHFRDAAEAQWGAVQSLGATSVATVDDEQ
jgi:ATP-binding cassette subfamily B protein